MLKWIKNKLLGERIESQVAPKTERYYQLKCNEIFQGKVEYRLADSTRVDILTDDLAIEIDFASKWYEAIGQACHYSRMTGKRPAILLIVKEQYQEKYIEPARKASRITKVKVGDDYHSIAFFVYRDC